MRALRLRPAKEQKVIRAKESERLDKLAEAVRNNSTLDAAAIEKRLHTIEQLRGRLVAD